jgi:ribosomal protein S18 acetylase RimI-like enzyme
LIREAVARRVAVSLSVVPANVPALAFYLRLGFRVVAQSEPVIHLKHEGPQESAV